MYCADKAAYSVTETQLSLVSGFTVSASCAAGSQGSAVVTACTGKMTTLSRFGRAQTISLKPYHDFSRRGLPALRLLGADVCGETARLRTFFLAGPRC